METISELLKNAESNKILVAVLGGGIFWQILTNIRGICAAIWGMVISCISFTVNSVSVGDYDRQLLRYKIDKVISRSKVLWERNSEIQPSSSNYSETHLMNAAFGRSYRWMWGHLVVLDRTYSRESAKVVINITARVFFARRGAFIKRLMKEIEECSLNDSRDTVLVNMGEGIFNERMKRKIGSIYTNDNVAQRMLSDVRSFIDNKDTYLKSNSPYKFVGLLCGTPGSGKTSTIHAIASELGMGVRFINMDKSDFESIARTMSHCNDDGERNIIVMEDIDCLTMNADESRSAGAPKGRGEKYEVVDEYGSASSCGRTPTRSFDLSDFKVTMLSLSSILNLLDGLATTEGTIVFLTTNNPEKLDKALLRDGRVDVRYDFGNFTKETANRMIFDYLGIRIEDIRDGIVPASLQRDILRVSIGRMTKEALVDKYSEDKHSEDKYSENEVGTEVETETEI